MPMAPYLRPASGCAAVSGETSALHFGRFDSPAFGGLERMVGLLLGGLASHIRVANLVAQDNSRQPRMEHKQGYQVYRAHSFGLIASVPIAPALPFMARRLWRSHGYRIAHLHFPDPLSHFATTLLPRGAKIVITWHSDVIRQTRLMGLYRPWLDRIVRRADAIVLPTPKHLEVSTQLGAIADSGKVHIIPHGIDYRPFAATPEVLARAQAIRAEAGGRTIVFAVGRHVYYKGFEHLIRAAGQVDALILIGGSGPLYQRNLAEVARLGVGTRVRLLGRIPEVELPAYYHACDVFCMPSIERSEAFGLVQLEAMGCGKPVICCELGNGVSYVNRHGETGLIVPPRDPAALAEAIATLGRDPALAQRLGAAGAARAQREFTVDVMVERYLALYRRLSS